MTGINGRLTLQSGRRKRERHHAMSNETSGKPASVSVNVTSQVKVTATNFTFNRISRTYNSTVTVENISQHSVAGPVYLVLTNLPAGVTLEPRGDNRGQPLHSGYEQHPGSRTFLSLSIRVQRHPPRRFRTPQWSIPGVLRKP
jgi:hypothetical protein